MIENSTQNNASSSEEFQMRTNLFTVKLKMAIVQVLVAIFLYVNCFMIFTFFKKEAFRTSTRYILFAQSLLVDTTLLVLIDVVVLITYLYIFLPIEICILLCLMMELLSNTTPFTITAMCLERYVAICMPLRHADVSTIRRSLIGIVIIWALSSINIFVDLFIVIALASPGYYAKNIFCYYEFILISEWHSLMRSMYHILFHFLAIAIVLLFCYIKIMAAARAASGHNKESSSKGIKTLLLHSAQLGLCLSELWCPYLESVIMKLDFEIYLSVRYFIFITFTIASRCLSPLIYGLRDEKFFSALKHYANFRLHKTVSPIIVQQ